MRNSLIESYRRVPQSIPPKQSLGQHFLIDPNMVRKIVASLRAPADAPVVEIGPGTGALTGELLERYPRLTAIEIDERAVELLRTEFPNLDVRQADVLEFDWAEFAHGQETSLFVIGNLPYYVTSPILFALLDARSSLQEAVLMMQKEVAERLVASPRTKDYGILSVQTQAFAHPEVLFEVSRHVFRPQPNVTSAIVRLTFDDVLIDQSDADPAFFRTVVRTAFNQRRKTLRNSLHPWTRERGIALPHDWERRRAEELTPPQFVELAQHLRAHISQEPA